MFTDVAKIKVIAGKGGDGAVSFHREKFIAAGGPDGGDGGKGGDVILVVDDHMATLLDFRYKRKYAAQNGAPGAGKKCSGKNGADLIIKVPRATVIRDPESGAIIHDMSDGEPFVIAKGGNGGWGNQHFATPTRQAPRFAKSGLPGEEKEILLELKLLADVGLVGFPNVGKSTLLSMVSSARPKIANYHFTTLQPNLGVVSIDETESFVVADIPGIIEGAHAGSGLGHDFLRHIDRCRLLIHLVDAAGSEGRDPIEDFKTINKELALYNSDLASRPQIVAANKIDILDPESDTLNKLKEYTSSLNIPCVEISAATGKGVDELMYKVAQKLRTLPPIQYYESEYTAPEQKLPVPDDVTVRVEDGTYILEGDWLMLVARDINFEDHEARIHFERTLRRSGIFERLEKMGIQNGDTVRIYNLEFEYVD
ncbi:MAG: GTPase ObgE [Eubacteriales bacterium]|jgi:GTP-binding protein